MYGWRGRIGVIIPCINTATEPEFNRLALQIPGLAVHAARVHLEETADKGLTRDALFEMERQALNTAVPELQHAGVGVIVYACTSGSFAGGPGWDSEIIQSIREKTGLPTTTTTTAMVSGLKYLNAKRVAFGTPYDEALTRLGVEFLEQEGFEVVNTVALDNLDEINSVRFSLAYQLGRRVDAAEADAICISCTDFPTLDVLDVLERDLHKPVISANLASLWHALTLLGIDTSIRGSGKLLSG